MKDVLFVSSNFKRARETAEECIRGIQLSLAVESAYAFMVKDYRLMAKASSTQQIGVSSSSSSSTSTSTSTSYDQAETDLLILKLMWMSVASGPEDDVDYVSAQSPVLAELLLGNARLVQKELIYRMFELAHCNSDPRGTSSCIHISYEHLVSSSRIIIPYHHLISSSHIIISYHHLISSSRIIIPYHYLILPQHT